MRISDWSSDVCSSDLGLGEAEFLTAFDASFKQGSRFDGWVDGGADDRYFHPFTSPPDAPAGDLLAAWRAAAPDLSFAAAMTPQVALCAGDLAPRQRAMPDFQGAANYAYHLDARSEAHTSELQSLMRISYAVFC